MTIAAGTKYWLVAATSTNALTWNMANAGTTYHYFDGGYTGNGNDTDAAFSVQVTPTPEPTTLATLGLGVVGLVRRRRR